MNIYTKLGLIKNRQQGQALTEFVIGAAFVMVPLFLLISISGKNADIKYASVQAARYEAWEYTANYHKKNDATHGFKAVSAGNLPIKDGITVRREARRRFFSDSRTLLSSNLDRKGYLSTDANPLWRYHDGSQMIDPAIDAKAAPATLKPNETTPDLPLPVITKTLAIIKAPLEFFAKIFSAIGIDAGFTAIDEKGLAKSSFSVYVADTPRYLNIKSGLRTPLMPTVSGLTMKAEAAVLTNGWTAGGTAQTTSQVRGLVPTMLLDELLTPAGINLQAIFRYIPGLHEFSDKNLKFGKLLTDEKLHPSKIKENTGSHACDKAGVCVY